MKEFILLVNKGTTIPDFPLDDLHVSKVDMLCRLLINSLCVSNGIRRDVKVHISLLGPKDPPKLLTFDGSKIKDFENNDLKIAKTIRKMLGERLNMNESKEVGEGLTVTKIPFENFLKAKIEEGVKLLFLDKKGEIFSDYNFPENFLCVIGDHSGIPHKTEKFILGKGGEKISLGRTMLLASQCSIVILNHIDNR